MSRARSPQQLGLRAVWPDPVDDRAADCPCHQCQPCGYQQYEQLAVAPWPCSMAGLGPGLLVVFEPVPAYRPRHLQATVLFRLLEQLYERVSLLWEERFEPRYGPWRGFYDQEVARYLDCLSSQGTASSSAASPVFTVTPVATTSSQAGMLFPIHNRARPYPRELPSATGFTPTSLQVAPAQLDEGP